MVKTMAKIMQSLECEEHVDIPHCANAPDCTETILIVEDEIDIAEIASFHLKSMGYETVYANSAKEALHILGSGQEVDLVFSDVVLPGSIGGFRLVQKINEKFPSLKLLLTSAYFEEPLDIPGNKLITNLTQSLLKKPYTKADLLDAVTKTLNQGSEASIY